MKQTHKHATQKHGEGTYIWMKENEEGEKEERAKYVGNYADGLKSGVGKMVFPNGDIYEGQFVRNERHGRGRYLSVRGEEYDGGWAHGKRDGQGVSVVLPQDEAARQRQRVSASLLVHRDKHFFQLQSARAQGRA